MGIVYRGADNWFYSESIKREFGVNKMINKFNGEKIFSVVMPLKVNPLLYGLELFGTIKTK